MTFPICMNKQSIAHSDPEKKRKRWELDASLLQRDHALNPENTRTVFYLAQVNYTIILPKVV